MPITPFHFGPGAALHALAPRQVSFIAFCSANVLIDVEPLYFILTHQYPVHRLLHSYLGATLALPGTLLLFLALRAFARRFWLPDLFRWQSLTLRAVVIGAALGAYSHVLLDSLMHSDIRPLAPFSDANPLLRLVPLATLHWLCVLAGMAGLVLLAIRDHRANRRGSAPGQISSPD